jgi:hypothetical protein
VSEKNLGEFTCACKLHPPLGQGAKTVLDAEDRDMEFALVEIAGGFWDEVATEDV